MPSEGGDVKRKNNASQQTAFSPQGIHHEVCSTWQEAAEGRGNKAQQKWWIPEDSDATWDQGALGALLRRYGCREN